MDNHSETGTLIEVRPGGEPDSAPPGPTSAASPPVATTGEAEGFAPTAIGLYTHLLRHGPAPLTALAGALGLTPEGVRKASLELSRHRLLTHAPDDPDGPWHAISPYAAAAEIVGPEESRLRRRLEDLERTRARLDSLTPLYEDARRGGTDSAAVETVSSRDRVMLLISDAAARCTEEVLTVQPGGGRPAGHLERALPRDLEMLRRGVRLHTLYQHTARYNPGTQEYVVEAGAEVRTLGELFGKMVVFDRSLAFLPVWDDPDSAVVLREPSAVAFLRSVFTHVWNLAEPFSTSYTTATSIQLRDSIAARLVTGAKDEQIARRLGMSLRTCRRHIAQLMEELGAESRFQAGYLLALQTRDPARPTPPETSTGP
ncbi:LuxR C-terminal-related transcriptional regulator [Streptomyces sp. NPDC056488]|uniref:LuxR C-terminal-related transcriptional regulator n=1 Tax=Streptomyces sp. NPDC056488 TaxID=3345836 RepID=UPI0036BE2A97